MTIVATHLRRNAIAYAALFVALSGTAYAAGKIGANDIKPDAVRSKHVKDGQIRAADVADTGIGSAELATGAVGADALAAGAVGSNAVADGSLTGADIAAASLAGADIAEDTLGGREVRESTLIVDDVLSNGLDEDETSCNPQTTAFVVCARASFPAPPLGFREALVIATVTWFTDGGGARGNCHLTRDGDVNQESELRIGEVENTTGPDDPNSTTLIAAFPFSASSTPVFDVRCNQLSTDLVIDDATLGVIGTY